MPFLKIIHRIWNFSITVILWSYFLFGYLFLLAFLYIPAFIIARKMAATLQNINHVHLRCFFALTRALIRRTKFEIPDQVRELRSCVIVCNHLSYLDPILLVSIYPRQITIVKNTFFKVPIFGWFLKSAGYIPSAPNEMMGAAMINNLESIKKHLADGGILFVFPEGTRSRDGKLAPFNKGVFSIARYCRAPINLVLIRNTNLLFRHGYFSFNTRVFNTIKLELIGTLEPDFKSYDFSVSAIAENVRKLFEKKL
ncbi:MAG TPA: lysophospholipid acyltransferase family protein [Smithellaceae bacterium]|nr:lysophospholipid acyltransferase family protein [Smithellaceae bacterium]HRS90140.1 lysophospholipid acyltransferase family protein [Smithellaceae bacterium]HRV26965.1 lysophospholipid acyltransferase family protein [Smithellaceae bacterium]